MAVSQKVFVLNGGLLTQRARTTSRGTKDRFSINIKAEPILIDLDEHTLGMRPAEAITKVLKRKIRTLNVPAEESTIAWRRWAATNKLERYTGGRLGVMLPGVGGKLFNDSGRLATGILARFNRKEGGYTINVPANRFDHTTFGGGMPKMLEMINRLATLIPEFRDSSLFKNAPEFEEALVESAKAIHKKKMPLGTTAERAQSEAVRLSSGALSEMARFFRANFGIE